MTSSAPLSETNLHLELNPERVVAALGNPDRLRIWFRGSCLFV